MPETHPIPQQISSYSFKLVGDMTLKQFIQIAGGALVSLFFYASPLNPFIRWPIIVVSFLFGIALAFLPIEDRSLSTWVFIFFRSIYSPTLFTWQKLKKAPVFFQDEIEILPTQTITAKEEVPQTDLIIRESPQVTELEQKEKTFLTSVSQHFISPGTTVVISDVAPPLTSTVHKDINIPKTQVPVIEKAEGVVVKDNVVPEKAGEYQDITPSSTQVQQNIQKAKFSDDVMPPIPPSKPNTIVGQVLDSNGKIIEGAVLEIRDQEGRPVRALKTNRLGHFMIITPLLSGNYVIKTEKEGFDFDPISFEAVDKLIPPIAIWAKNVAGSVDLGIQNSGSVPLYSNKSGGLN